MDKVDRIGETNINYLGSPMVIIEYVNKRNIKVEFLINKNKVYTNYYSFIKGTVKNPYDKTVYNHGFIGEGDYKPSIKSIHTPQYESWIGILRRCYDKKYQERQPTYRNCTVCKEWHNFQTFAQWYDDNYYEIKNQRMELDKDILIKGNKKYSPETCCFVPNRINVLFTKHNGKRGTYPIGVSFNKDAKKFKSFCNNEDGSQELLGYYSTPELAFNTYKIYKETLIKNIADKYKDSIPQKLYDAMYAYEVEITD